MRRLLVVAALCSACGGSSPSPTAPSTPPVVVAPAPIVPPAAPTPARDPRLFSQVFWDMFVHDTLERPTERQPLRRFPSAPMLYIQVNDGAGRPIDSVTLNAVQNAMMDAAAIWGGGQFGLAGVERGTASHVGDSGWITVRWYATSEGAFCGQSRIGAISGEIDLNYLYPGGGCGMAGGSKICPTVARHELGHAFGYYHTDSGSDVMSGLPLQSCDLHPSPRETYHATLAYQTPLGSTERVPQSVAEPRVIID